MLKFLVLLALVAVAEPALFGRTQSAAVRGRLTCNGQPASNVKVKLYDNDKFSMDDLMAQGRTDSSGMFVLSGKASDLLTINPKLNVYHVSSSVVERFTCQDCNDGITPCQRRITLFIPSSYVSSGATPQRTYDAGSIELAGKFKGETRDCLN